jgi:hypothetical protein
LKEIAENCQGVKLVLVALKCDLRESDEDEEGEEGPKKGEGEPRKEMIDYDQGLAVARKIQVRSLSAISPFGTYLTSRANLSNRLSDISVGLYEKIAFY